MKIGLWILLIVAGGLVVWWLLALVVGWLSYVLGFVAVAGIVYALVRLFSSAKPETVAPKAERKIEKAAVRELKSLEKQQEKQTLGRK